MGKKVNEPKSYDYLAFIQGRIIKARMDDTEPMKRPFGLKPDDPRNLRRHIAPSSPPSMNVIREGMEKFTRL